MKKYNLEVIVFICGAVVMVLEITGSRVLAPFLGTSLFVWTSLIGIILGSLSLGYWLGGRLADKKTSYKIFSFIIFIAAILIAITSFIKNGFLELIQTNISDIRIGSIIAATVLFAPASIFLGMISPYAVKLKLENLEKSGQTVGKLYALSTVGSIVGTFLAGFWLLAFLGNTKLLMILAIVLALTSLLASGSNKKIKIIVALLILGNFTTYSLKENKLAQAGIIELDTDYNHVQIYKSRDPKTDQQVQTLDLGRASHSSMFLENDDLVFEYTKFYNLAKHFRPDLENSLIIGGGAYSYPKYYLKHFPEADLDVVEIDPQLTELARKYFRLEENPRLNIYHEDGRTFLNKNTYKYDVIFGDAFHSFYSIPYQLTTVGAIQKIYDSLTDDGIVLVNIISSMEGKTGKFLKAEYATLSEVFPQVYIFPVNHPENPNVIQNIILLGMKSDKKPDFKSDDPELQSYLKNLYTKEIQTDLPILTDDFAPVDQYIMELL